MAGLETVLDVLDKHLANQQFLAGTALQLRKLCCRTYTLMPKLSLCELVSLLLHWNSFIIANIPTLLLPVFPSQILKLFPCKNDPVTGLVLLPCAGDSFTIADIAALPYLHLTMTRAGEGDVIKKRPNMQVLPLGSK